MRVLKIKELLKKSFRVVISLADYEDAPVPDRFASTQSELVAMIEDYMNIKAQELPPTTTDTDDIETDIHDENDVIQTLSAFEHPSSSPARVQESASSAPIPMKKKGGDKSTASSLSGTGSLSVAINSAYEANYKAYAEYSGSREEDPVVSPLPHSRSVIVVTKQDAHHEDTLSSPPSSRHRADSPRSHGAPSPPSSLHIVSPGDAPDVPSLSNPEDSPTRILHAATEPSNVPVSTSEEREIATRPSGTVARRAQPLRRHDTFFYAGWPTFPGEDLDPTRSSLSPSPFSSSFPLPSTQKISGTAEHHLIMATADGHSLPRLVTAEPETGSASRAPSPREDNSFLSPSRTDSNGEDANEAKPENRKATPAIDPSRRLSRTFALSDESEFEQYDQFQRMQRDAQAEPPTPKAHKRQREDDDEEAELMAPSPKRIKKEEEDHIFESASMLAPAVPSTLIGRIVIPPAPARRVTRSATRRALAAAAAANPAPPAAPVATERSAPISSGRDNATRRGRKAPAKSSSSSKKTKTKRKSKKDN